MTNTSGIKRVVISNVSPHVQHGAYAVKAILNQTITVSADIFCDGNDEIVASILYKHSKERKWKELPLTLVDNDRWECSVLLDKLGIYEYRVQAWVDHFGTWQKNIWKKIVAGQDVKLEWQMGADLVKASALLATAKDKKLLDKWAATLQQSGDTADTATLEALHLEISGIMRCTVPKDLITIYPLTLKVEAERQKAENSTWYELFPRSASQEPNRHGTFNDVKALLPRIAKMGFDVLYFPPIHPIGEEKRKGRNNALTAAAGDPGSPWAIGNKKGGHKAIHPQLGTLKDFKALVAEAKKYNIEIALDIAFQCAPDHPYVKEHPQWFKWRPDGTVQYAENPPKKYEDILPFNFETDDWQNLWKELKSIFEYWIAQGITIFRVDNPHTKSFLFWEWVIGDIRKDHPEIIFLAEAFTRPRLMERLATAGFNQSYTYFAWRNTKQELETYIKELTETDLRYYFRPNFWPNTPDILTDYLVHGGENAHIIRVILAATMSASYGIYGPVYEFGINTPMPGKEEYTDNEKYEIRHWNWNKYTRIGKIIARVNRIRRENTALQTAWNISFAETNDEHIICYCKQDKENDNTLIIAVNLDPHNTHCANVKIPLYKIGIPYDTHYQVHDLLSDEKYTWFNDWNYVELNPHNMPAHIFKITHHE